MRSPLTKSNHFHDLSNQKFGKWNVITRGKNSGTHTRWICRCDCGAEKLIFGSNLVGEKSRQCKNCSNIKHGFTRSHTYSCYYSMIQRCRNPNSKFYHSYGGRGITVCEKWMNFEGFLEDIGEIPDGLELDRINNDLGYFPENCRLVTHKVNMNNRRNSIRISSEYQGWIVKEKASHPKKYVIFCKQCNLSKEVQGSHLKQLKTHKCVGKNEQHIQI